MNIRALVGFATEPTMTKMPKPLDNSATETRRHASHCLWLWVLWLMLFAVTRAAVADATPDLLTPVQRAWLKAHPRIVIGGGDDWPPWLIRNQSGTLSGFAVDHLALLNAKLGTAIQLQAGPWHEIVVQAEAGVLDGLTLSSPLPERRAHFLFTEPFVTVPDFLYLRDGESPSAGGLTGLAGRRVGYLRSLQRVHDRLAAYPAIEAIPMDSQVALAEALIGGRIDAVVGSYALDYWRARHGVLGLGPKQLLPPEGPLTQLVYSVRRDWPQLVDILNRGLAAITEEETAALHRRWFGAAISEREASGPVQLDAPERAWLRQHPVLRVGIDSTWAPVEYVDDDGRPQGISVAYLKRLEDDLEVRFELVPMPSWSTAMHQLGDGKIDLLAAIADLPARRRLLFTEPYASFPAAIFARNEVAYLGGIDALVGKRIAVVRDDAVEAWLADRSPEIDLLPVVDTREGLRAVSDGNAFAFIGNLATTSYYLSQSGLTDIKVAGETAFRYRLSMAVGADRPLLAGILRKGLDAVPASERAAIYNQWRSIRYSHAMDLNLLWQVLAGGAALLAMVGWWNRRLAREVKRRCRAEVALIEARDQAERASRAKSDFLSNISHELRTPLNLLLGTSSRLREHLGQRRVDTPETTGLDTIMAAVRTLAHLIDDLLDLSRIEAGQLRLMPSSTDLRGLLRELVALFAQVAADKGLRLTLDLDAGLSDAVRLDAQRLRQVLINLIGNAVKFTDAGTIRLHALAEPSGPDRVRLRISIQDSGPGIDNALLGSIFEPFEQIPSSAYSQGKAGAGLGLGLSISRRLARLMGGEIAVESQPGHGSRFTLELPDTPVVPLAPDTAPSGVVVPPTGSAGPGATHSTRDPAHTSSRDRLQTPPTPPATDASPAAAVVSRLPADLREQLRTLNPPLTSINTIEGFIELLSARARELDDVDLRRIAEELREAAEAFDLPALGACLDRLGNPAERAAMSDRSASAPNAGGARRRILVVDDEQAGLRLAGRLLLEQGFEVFAALDGATAIEIAQAVTPGLVLLDLAMPGVDGLATCAALKESSATRAIPVIFLTGRADEPSLLDAFEVGAADYVVKPFEPQVLLARVRAHFELALLSRDLEGALSERTRELKAANDQLRGLATELSLSEDRERSRLAGALHDGPMQKFALAQIQIDALLHPRREMAASEPRTEEPGDAALALMNEAIAELRTLQFDLSPPVLHQRGLVAALEWLAESMSRRSGLALDCVIDDELPPLSPAVSVLLYQCARELVVNLIKHASATGGDLLLRSQGEELVLTIEDDGQGFAPGSATALPTAAGGYGLASIRDRLKLFDGDLAIASGATGSRITLRLPLAALSRTTGAQPTDERE